MPGRRLQVIPYLVNCANSRGPKNEFFLNSLFHKLVNIASYKMCMFPANTPAVHKAAKLLHMDYTHIYIND